MSFPKITDQDRAAGFRDWKVKLRDGGTETLRVFKPKPAKLLEFLRLPSKTAGVYRLDAHAIRKDVAYLQDLDSSAICEIYFVAVGLNSQAAYDFALAHSPEIGWQMIFENLPGQSGQSSVTPKTN
jgi:hypothetical protein